MIKREVSKKDKSVKVTFVQPVNGTNATVSVVGDFNDWDPAKGRLVKRANGTASHSVTLEPGRSYRFRYYRSDGSWFNDEAADAYETNALGSEDCILHLNV